MKPEFKAAMTTTIRDWMNAGFDPVAVLRDVEILCGKANEEFDGHGKELVETVYGGRFVPKLGGQGLIFVRRESVPLPPLVPEKIEVKAAPEVAPEEQPSTGDEADGKDGIQERGIGDGKEAGNLDEGSKRGAGSLNTQGGTGSAKGQSEPQPGARPVKK